MIKIAPVKNDITDGINEFLLDNGLRIIHHPTASKVTYCGYAIDAGTRDEWEKESGMAHFIEHLIFKGTEKRKAGHILNRLSNVGGDADAYTNKEETIVYATVLNEDFERALDLLSDMVFHSTFPISEINRETEVILDEIQSYEDTPSELIYDDFENLIFEGHPLGRNILGKPDVIRQFGSADALSYTNRFYRPDNMILFVSGNLEFKKIIHLAHKYTADLTTNATQKHRLPPLSYETQHVNIKRDTHQAHAMIGCLGYKAYDDRSPGFYLLNNILGGPAMNNRLNVSLRERCALVYTVESSLTPYTDTGTFSIYFGCDLSDVDRCLELTYRELQKLRNNKLSHLQLSIAKRQLIGQIGIAGENEENNILDIAKNYLHYNRYDTLEEVYNRIEAITAEELLDIANDKLAEKNLTTLIYR